MLEQVSAKVNYTNTERAGPQHKGAYKTAKTAAGSDYDFVHLKGISFYFQHQETAGGSRVSQLPTSWVLQQTAGGT